jgi:cupin superfamily acireductone dioxygenase involved in methionine salvage
MEDIIIIKEKDNIFIEPNEDDISLRTPHFELEDIKNKIESMDELHHIEILKILKKSASIKLNENKSGIFVNLSFLSSNILDEIKTYINYINVQETSISHLETQCDEFKNTFFIDKEDKDNIVLYNSLVK